MLWNTLQCGQLRGHGVLLRCEGVGRGVVHLNSGGWRGDPGHGCGQPVQLRVRRRRGTLLSGLYDAIVFSSEGFDGMCA